MKPKPSIRGVLPFIVLLSLVPAALALPGCSSVPRSPLVLATTTSTEDSGILDEFVKQFEAENPYRVKSIAVGSGAALFMGQNGDADVMLTHEPFAERQFMAAGYGETHDRIMHNDFIIVGPKSDPAGIRGLRDADEAFRRIAARGVFVSRADASGTNAMEESIWKRIGTRPPPDRYIETGQGMGETMVIAQEKKAYTLCDRATFIVMEEGLGTEMLVEGDPRLLNVYSVTVVNPARFKRINHEGAVKFREFLLSDKTQKYIAGYGWDRYHQHLFYPH